MASIHFFEDLKLQQRIQIAQYVTDYTTGECGAEAKMKPVSLDAIMADEWGALVALEEDEFAGYVTRGQILPGRELDYQQIGSLVVPKAFRCAGIARELVEHTREQVIGEWCIPFALCNPKSMPVFSKAGFEVAFHDELPAEAQSLYGNTGMVYPMYKFIDLESWGTHGHKLD